jgi:hypothetical protein
MLALCSAAALAVPRARLMALLWQAVSWPRILRILEDLRAARGCVEQLGVPLADVRNLSRKRASHKRRHCGCQLRAVLS